MNKNLLAAALGALVIASPFTAQAVGPGPGFGPGPALGQEPGFGPGPAFGQGPGFGQRPGFGPGSGAGCPLHGPQCLMGDGGPGRMGRGGGIDAHLAMMSARLRLTPEQQAEIRNILEVQQATRQVIAKALREAMREQVDSVLTPEQQAQHARMMAWRDQGRGGMGGPAHCASGGARPGAPMAAPAPESSPAGTLPPAPVSPPAGTPAPHAAQ